MKDFWNNRYAREEYAYGILPNAYFQTQLDLLQPGKLLLPAEGEGRNAVYAAEKGWKVDAFDYSESGRDKALALARQRNVSIRYDLMEVDQYTCEAPSYTAAALIFAHLPGPMRKRLHAEVVQCLCPGGHLILEAFSPAQLPLSSGGPKKVEMLYTAEMLRDDFSNLQILNLTEKRVQLEEGPYHTGEAEVVRLLARKK
jgi:hypothetical protein